MTSTARQEIGPPAASPLRAQLLDEAERRGITLCGPVAESGAAIGSRGDLCGTALYLKVLAQNSDERLAGPLLTSWSDGPVVRVRESTPTVQVLEWITPGWPLEQRYTVLGDESSLLIVAEIASALKALNAPDIGFPTAHERGRSLLTRAQPREVEAELWRLGAQHYEYLAASQREPYVLHGDLHHLNVLWADQRGWVAIDPKGVVAELEFEMACALRNPISKLHCWARPEALRCRVRAVASALGADEERLLGWSFAQCVLAAAWELEDGLDASPWITAAHAHLPLLS